MKRFKEIFLTKKIVFPLIFMLILITLEKSAFSGMVGSRFSNEIREENIQTMKKFLNNKIVEDKLSEWGYSKDEISQKINQLSDEELQFFASRAQSIEVGGDAVGAVLGFILALLLIALLVILILELTGHDVVIKTKKR